MIDGSTKTRKEAVELVADARIQVACGERSFAFLMGLREMLYAWLAEVELELREKVEKEPFGYFAEGAAGGQVGEGEAYEEMVIGDPRVSAELTNFFEAGQFSDPADTFEPAAVSDTSESVAVSDMSDPAAVSDTPEPAAVSDTSEPAAVFDMSEPAAVSDTSESATVSDTSEPVAVSDMLELVAVSERVESVGSSSSLSVDTRQVLPSEWPTGMVPTESGVGWKSGNEADDPVRKQAAARAFEMLLRGRSIREVGRLVVGRRRAGT